MAAPDPKPAARIKDPDLMRQLHHRWRDCFLQSPLCGGKLELHHVHSKPRDDVEANLVMLCLHHHALITANDPRTWMNLRIQLSLSRGDVRMYLSEKLGGQVAARAWFDRHTTEVVRPAYRAT